MTQLLETATLGIVGQGLHPDSVRKSAFLRGLSLREGLVATAIAALDVGKHLVVVGEPARAEAFAEVIGDEAADSGLCLGTLGVTGRTAALLSLSDVLVDRFRDDFWLILRQADLVSLERLVHYVAVARPSPSWRFIGASAIASRGVLHGLSPAEKRSVALVELD